MSHTPNWDSINDLYRCRRLRDVLLVMAVDLVKVETFIRLYLTRNLSPDEVVHTAVARKDWAFIRASLAWGSTQWDMQLDNRQGAPFFEMYNRTSLGNMAYLAIRAPRDIRRYALWVLIHYDVWKRRSSRKS